MPDTTMPDSTVDQWIMAEQRDPQTLEERLRGVPGLASLVAEAEATWRARADAAGTQCGDARPGWRTFEDAFPTFYEFTNRPR